MPIRDYTQVIFLIFFFAVAGYRTFIAWFRPEQHKLDLEAMSKWYSNWSPYTEKWITSTFGYWITRFVYFFAFMIVTIALLQTILERLFG